MPKIHRNITQNSEAWKKLRSGRLTGSNAQAIATAGKGLESLVGRTMADYFATTIEATYTNEAMERGVILEAEARKEYEFQRDVVVEQVGFISRDKYSGISPDGLVSDGGIEIKCHNNHKHFQLLLGGEMDKIYWWQCQMFMLVSERKWIDYVAYNPNFKKCLFIKRIFPDQEAFTKLEEGIKKGTEMIKKIKKQYNKIKL